MQFDHCEQISLTSFADDCVFAAGRRGRNPSRRSQLGILSGGTAVRLGCGGGGVAPTGAKPAEVVERQGDPLSGRHADPPDAGRVTRRRVECDVVDQVAGVGGQRDGGACRTLGLVVGRHCTPHHDHRHDVKR